MTAKKPSEQRSKKIPVELNENTQGVDRQKHATHEQLYIQQLYAQYGKAVFQLSKLQAMIRSIENELAKLQMKASSTNSGEKKQNEPEG